MLPLDQSINMYVVAVVEDDPTANQQSVLVFSHSQSKDISVNIPEPVNTKSTVRFITSLNIYLFTHYSLEIQYSYI
jgi:hypothetical protein